MAWRWKGDKPKSEPMMAYFTDVYMRHTASLSELTKKKGDQWGSEIKGPWNFKGYPISHPNGWAMGFLLGGFWSKITLVLFY